ncbi:unnamed protein product [Fusarium fujikuroi]|nr:unnamed protein product [Fusarium fujikuroi]
MNEPRPDRRRHMGHVIAVEPLPEAFANLEHRPFNHEAIDFPQIKEWIEYCDKNHLQRCKPEKFTLPPNFKVIDCREPEDINREEPTVVSVGDDCEYAALSYVWGNIEDKFPQVVKDSIKVARQLKCEYLWVDRLGGGDLYERVGTVNIRGGFEYSNKARKSPAKLTMYKDKSGRWMTRAPISNPRDCIWQKDLERKTIVLQ